MSKATELIHELIVKECNELTLVIQDCQAGRISTQEKADLMWECEDTIYDLKKALMALE